MSAVHSRGSRSIGWLRARLRPIPYRDDSRWLSAAAGVLGSLLLHALLIDAVLLGNGARSVRPPQETGLGANAIVSDEEARATLVLIEASGIAASEAEPRESPASQGTLLQSVRLTVISPEPVREPAFELDDASDDPRAAIKASTDEAGRARQFGLYVGQIQARIERAWLRPRSALDGNRFSCVVEILQSPRGDVREITLPRCDADTRWQLSLVRAIERASPLPAPPDPVVFSESLQLAFESAAYAAGGNEEGFEPASVALVGTQSGADLPWSR